MKMLKPENDEVTCPISQHPEVHFNSKNGFYCMTCGNKFSSKEAKVLVEHEIFQTEAESSS